MKRIMNTLQGHECESGHVCQEKQIEECPSGQVCTPQPECVKLCPMCMILCKYGMRQGDDGCPKCECKESVCEVGM